MTNGGHAARKNCESSPQSNHLTATYSSASAPLYLNQPKHPHPALWDVVAVNQLQFIRTSQGLH